MEGVIGENNEYEGQHEENKYFLLVSGTDKMFVC